MKKVVKISRISMVCVLCAAGLSPALGASSIRSFGTGTYGSASSATAAGTAAINSARASSIRATASMPRATTSAGTAASSAARTASNSAARLSVGSYLQGGRTIQGGSSIKSQNPTTSSTSTTNNNTNTVMQSQIDVLSREVEALQDSDDKQYKIVEVDSLLDKKQDVLVAGSGIDITGNTISAIVSAGDIAAGTIVNADVSDTAAIEKTKLAQDAQDSLAKADTALQQADLTDYATKVDVTNVVNTAITNVNTELVEYTKTVDLGAMAMKDTVATADINVAAVTRAKLGSDVTNSLDLADTALQSADLATYSTTTTVNKIVSDAVAGAVADLGVDIDGKADKATTLAGYGIKDAMTATETADAIAAATTGKADAISLGALAVKDTVATADIDDNSVAKAKLAADVRTSLGLADTALQPDAPGGGADYVLVVNGGTEKWFEVAY
ncbi:MAG: hypothetical protein LBJ73_04480 [Rickettsiales bacterium]|jgi:hypothetical protein|nr:hypothetical protein [Rickettsiales bacterium]